MILERRERHGHSVVSPRVSLICSPTMAARARAVTGSHRQRQKQSSISESFVKYTHFDTMFY